MAWTMPDSSRIGGRRPLISRRVSSIARQMRRVAASKSSQALAGLRACVSRKPCNRNSAGKLLGKAVMNLVGRQSPLALVQFQQLPQQPLLLLDRLGGHAFLGHIGADHQCAFGIPFPGQRYQPARPPVTEDIEHSMACGWPVTNASCNASWHASRCSGMMKLNPHSPNSSSRSLAGGRGWQTG